MFTTMSVKQYIDSLTQRIEELQKRDEDEPIAVSEDVRFSDEAISDLIDMTSSNPEERGYFSDEDKVTKVVEETLVLKKLFVDTMCDVWNSYWQQVEEYANSSNDIWSDAYREIAVPFFLEHKEVFDFVPPDNWYDDDEEDNEEDNDDE